MPPNPIPRQSEDMPAVAANIRSVLETADLTREQLLCVAVARGCRHYAPLLPAGAAPLDVPGLSHEVLGAALLQGPADAGTFQAIRCGAMVLSDLGNSGPAILEASTHFGVAHRLAHLARLGLEADRHPEFWTAILNALPPVAGEENFLPGISRFTSETRMAGPGRGSVRTWLRTHYRR